MDILFEYFIFETPTTENVMKLVLKPAKMAIIRQPSYYMMSIARGMGFFWKKLSLPMINSLFESLTPTHERLINCLEPCECNAPDQKITTMVPPVYPQLFERAVRKIIKIHNCLLKSTMRHQNKNTVCKSAEISTTACTDMF